MNTINNKNYAQNWFFVSGLLAKSLSFVLICFSAVFLLSTTSFAATYFVAPDGDDDNQGTVGSPFKSIMKAQEAASEGDTVYLMDGTYAEFTIAATDSNYNYVHEFTKSGITYSAYKGGKPVVDFSDVEPTKRVAAFHVPVNVSDIKFIGLEVTGVKTGTQKQSECFRIQGNASFDRVTCHDTEAIGFYYTTKGSGSCINCDAYNNIGPTSTSIGNIDGFGFHGSDVTVQYCRSWNNSDDGYDCINCPGTIVFDHCWAYDMTAGGDSNGFKVGGGQFSGNPPETMPVHTVKYCLSACNNSNGFYSNHNMSKAADWIYNTSYNNARGNYNMLERVGPDDLTDIPGTREVLHYNISFKGTDILNDNLPEENKTMNSWTIDDVTVSSSDFISLDASQMTLPRKADGSLPDITFMHLNSDSDLEGLGCFN